MIKLTATAAAVLATAMVAPVNAQQQWGASTPAAAAASRAEAPAIDPRHVSGRERIKSGAVQAVITEGHIARLRVALKLTPAQHRHWVPVEAALGELARRQARSAAAMTSKFADRSSAVAATAHQLRRLKAVAMPLILTLDDNQKREAITFARTLGFQQLVAAF
jgi:hypothetical protein